MRDVIRELKCGQFLPVVIREYGCVRCRAYHREGDPLFDSHVMCQSKAGVRGVDVYAAVVETAAKGGAK